MTVALGGDSGSIKKIFWGMEANVLFVATDEQFLRTVVERAKAGRGEEAFPSDLPHWNYVKHSAKNFGLRKFVRRDGNRLYEMPDKEFKGATVEVAHEQTVVHWISTNESPLAGSEFGDWLKVADVKPGVTKLIGKPSEDHERTITYLSMFSMLIGPPLYL